MDHTVLLWLELGGVLTVLAVMARLARRLALSPIPLYLGAGLAFGEGGLLPLVTSEEFVGTGAELGVILLLLMLGLEYSGRELIDNMRRATPVGLVDLGLNFAPGFAAGLIMRMGIVPALFLGGVTYISSSGVIAKVVGDLGWAGNRETPLILSVLVFEDLAMAVILPVLGAVALGGTVAGASLSVAVALTAVAFALTLSVRHGERISSLAFSDSDEVNILSILGVTLIAAGLAEWVHVSAAVGAFLVGIGISGPAAHRAETLLSPLRDLFAAVFFVFFGLSTDPGVLPGVIVPVLALTGITAATKTAVAWLGGARSRIGTWGRWRAAAALVARGEFSIVIAALGVTAGASQRLSAIAAGYVLVTATIGPVAALVTDRLSVREVGLRTGT
ncbi:MAG: cation:proton antiporter [Actinobacteria bacterium]|nr:cation:proton antiporter [Actinomycetota bacterium]